MFVSGERWDERGVPIGLGGFVLALQGFGKWVGWNVGFRKGTPSPQKGLRQLVSEWVQGLLHSPVRGSFLPVLQDLTNSNIKRRILYDAIQAISASWNWVFWKAPIALPNCFLSFT